MRTPIKEKDLQKGQIVLDVPYKDGTETILEFLGRDDTSVMFKYVGGKDSYIQDNGIIYISVDDEQYYWTLTEDDEPAQKNS